MANGKSALKIPRNLVQISPIFFITSAIKSCLFFCAVVILLILSWLVIILPISETSIPNAAANDFRWTIFNSFQSDALPICLVISFCIPSKSPANANSRALSVLILRPSNIDASICAFIDVSKSNKLSAMLSTVAMLKPSFLAAIAALNTFCPPSFANPANASLELATSSIIFAGATPFACDNAATESNWAPTASILLAPTAIICAANTPELSPLIPYIAFNLAISLTFDCVIWPIPPRLSIIPTAPALTSSALTPRNFISIAVVLRIFCNPAASPNVSPNSLRVSAIPP